MYHESAGRGRGIGPRLDLPKIAGLKIEETRHSIYHDNVALERYLSADLSIFLLLILLMISVMHRNKREENFVQERLFHWICLSTMLMLGLDVLFRFTDGGPSRVLSYAVTWLYFVVEPLPMVFWLCYLDYFIYKSVSRLRKRLYYMPYFVAVLLVMAADPFTHWIFWVDEINRYRRGPYIAFIVLLNTAVLVLTVLAALTKKRDIEKRYFVSLVVFGMIPLTGNFLQFIFVGTILLWPSVAMAVIYIYIFIENQRDAKDYLTGLMNRRQIDARILSRLATLEKQGGFAVVMIDMDGFKSINDEFGHNEGDRALVQVASLIFRAVRSVDRVARFGGDEFIVFLEEESESEVVKVIERIYGAMEKFNGIKVLPYRLALSCGYRIVLPGESLPYLDLIHQADQNMYQVKKAKKAAGSRV